LEISHVPGDDINTIH